MLDSTRLRTELNQIHRVLDAVVATPRGEGITADLQRAAGGDPSTIVWTALFADCLRVAHCAMIADGQISDYEIDALYEFVFWSARRYAAALPETYGAFDALEPDTARAFLHRYATDRGPYGRGAKEHWPGLALSRAAAALGESQALERYELMMAWLIDAVCQIGGVTDAAQWQGRLDELHELRRALAKAAKVEPATAGDLRLQAFLEPTRAFSAVQHGFSVFENDPFDVDTIHSDARQSFEQMVERATSEDEEDRGGILVMLGESGAGKTHLLRSFRQHVHEYGRGFVAYAHLHSRAEDYARYLLQHVIDSLARPYAGPSGDRTGLQELASGLPKLCGEAFQRQVERLSQDSWETADNLHEYVDRLADQLFKHPALSKLDISLLRVLLYALHSDQAVVSRVYKYLRCEEMTEHDRKRIGGVAARTGAEAPFDMICKLAQLARITRGASLVLMIDQAELSVIGAGASSAMFVRAIDTLFRIVDRERSVVAVVACLTDLYDAVRPDLSKPMLDRIEQYPHMERLQLNRTWDEIVAIVGKRLAWMYAASGAVYRPEDPTYPIAEAHLRLLVNRRTRDILHWCRDYQARCVDAGKLVDPTGGTDAPIAIEPEAGEEPDHDVSLDSIAAAWNDARTAPGIDVPDTEDEILSALGVVGVACSEELGLALESRLTRNAALRAKLAGPAEKADLVIAVTNAPFQRGAFGLQIESLRRSAARTGAVAVAVRTIEFPRGQASAKAIADLLKAGGRRTYIDAAVLRTVAAYQRFKPAFPEERIAAWRKRDRPISSLPAVAEIFDLERLRSVAAPVVAEAPAVEELPIVEPPPKPPKPATPPVGVPIQPPLPRSAQLRVGAAYGFKTDPRTIELSSLLRHTGILGSPGSGKTTLALNLIEQLLERDVAVVLVDRKGDLAGYAKPDWWEHTADPVRAKALSDRLDVRLFTPGTRGGRPLSLSVVPDLTQVPEHDRDRMVQYAANALAAVMGFGDTANDTARRAILMQAIEILARRRPNSGLAELIVLIAERDDELLARAARYDDKLFNRLVQDLETVRLTGSDLFDASAEPLTAETLIGRGPGGKTPLAIASTRFLGEDVRIQSWVAHLVACLSRHIARSPRADLHTVLMIDEADLFMPAGSSKPPSKEPLQDMLKRARAGGLGVMLASQSPADFDYRSREQINTWFLGRIADKRSIEKMKPLFERNPSVGTKLGGLEPARFVMMQDGHAFDLERAPSLLRTEQLSEAELMALAAARRATG